MRYEEPETVQDAVALLAGTPGAQYLAGGATLISRMNGGMPAPGLLVSLHNIPSLFGITTTTDGVAIGAMATSTTLAGDVRLMGAMEAVRSAASQLAHPVIRNMGTIGGAIGLADPTLELPVALVATEAEVEVTGASGTRTVPIEDVFIDRSQTSLAPDEVITRINVPSGPAGAVGHHLRLSRVAGDYPTLSISLVLAVDGSGTCTHVRVALGSCGPVPLHVPAADQRLVGSPLSDTDIADAAALIVAASAPVDDIRGSADYRRTLIPRLLARAISQAREKINA